MSLVIHLLSLILLLILMSPGVWAKPSKKPKPILLVESVFKISDAPLSPRAKIFLLAGSSMSASFAREIVEQKRIWLKAGFQEEEIACYYIVPFQEDLNENIKQYLPVAGELSKCHAASAKLLREHLEEAAKRHPSFLYLYLSSHGERPISYSLASAKPKDEDYWALQREKRYPVFDQYSMLVEGLPDGTASSTEILGALRAGMSPDDLYVTPRFLKSIFEAGYVDTPKFVVLQGCFSGGFFEESDPRYRESLLSSLNRITLLAAARHDRSSFGCEPGADSTFYGGAYNESLARFARDPRMIDWKKLASEVELQVRRIEKKEKVSPPSLPQFFSKSAD